MSRTAHQLRNPGRREAVRHVLGLPADAEDADVIVTAAPLRQEAGQFDREETPMALDSEYPRPVYRTEDPQGWLTFAELRQLVQQGMRVDGAMIRTCGCASGGANLPGG